MSDWVGNPPLVLNSVDTKKRSTGIGLPKWTPQGWQQRRLRQKQSLREAEELKRKTLIALWTAVGIAGPSAIAVVTAPTHAYAATYPILSVGARGSAVKALQIKLQSQGYSVGTIDGVYGPVTEATVKRFQASHHLVVDGVAGPNTFRELNQVGATSGITVDRPPTSRPSSAPVATLPTSQIVRYGSTGGAVKVVQAAMNQLGFHCGAVDGVYGPATGRAIQAFQLAHHLQRDGIVGPQTWAALANALGDVATPTQSKPTSPPATGQSKVSGTSSSSSSVSSSANSSSDTAVPYPGVLIRFGSRGATVKEVQSQLNHLGYHCGPVDGIYGNMTYLAIRAFQSSAHLQVDGIIGPASWPKLFAQPSHTTSSGSAATSAGGDASSRGTNPLTTEFYAFDSNNHEIGKYSSQASAESQLTSVAGGYIKDSSGHVVWREGDYGAYDASGKLLGYFVSESEAKKRVTAIPGGTVRDINNSNRLVYTQPDVYAAYQSPTAAPQETTSLSSAEAYSQASAAGFVLDLAKRQVVEKPSDYFYLSTGGQWLHHLQGITIPTGSAHPAWAKQGELYVAVDTPDPPYYYDFYQISNVTAPVHTGTFENPFRNVDLRYNAPTAITADTINKWFTSVNSPLAGLGNAFTQAQGDYGVNAAYLAAHAFQETGGAPYWSSTSIPVTKNNLFGYGAFTSSPNSAAGFPSAGYAVRFEGWFIRENYLNDGAQFRYKWPTLDGMNRYYATDRNWSSDIATYMDALAQTSGTSSAAFTPFEAGNQPLAPSTEEEPVYALSGAQGVITSATTALSNYEMRPQLFEGANGYWVKQMQQALNAWGGTGQLAVDGDFGPQTLTALKTFQSNQGIGVDGVCGPNTWQHLESAARLVTEVTIPAGTKVTIDETRMGDSLTSWYRVSDAANPNFVGWVNGDALQLTNVYKVLASTGYEVSLSNGTFLRSGDYVVSGDGKSSVTYVDQSHPGSAVTATLKTGSLQRVYH